MHLPISSEDALHFYRYLHTHVLIVDEQFLLLINVPIQQIEIYEVFNLEIPHRNFSAEYNIQNKYLGIMHDETSAVEISEDQFRTYQKANGKFCILHSPLLHLANPPTCVSAMYAKDKDSIQKRCSLQISKASNINIPTSLAPNVWIITSPTTAVPSGITLICLDKHLDLSHHRHPFMYFNYNQHAAQHHNIFIYHHAMNPMKSLSTSC